MVDAIFGIGLKGKIEGIFKKAIQKMNSSNKTIVSVDIPSGLDANSGRILGTAIKANFTVTLIAPKKGLFLNDGPKLTGKLFVKDIGFPVKRFSKRRQYD